MLIDLLHYYTFFFKILYQSTSAIIYKFEIVAKCNRKMNKKSFLTAESAFIAQFLVFQTPLSDICHKKVFLNQKLYCRSFKSFHELLSKLNSSRPKTKKKHRFFGGDKASIDYVFIFAFWFTLLNLPFEFEKITADRPRTIEFIMTLARVVIPKFISEDKATKALLLK